LFFAGGEDMKNVVALATLAALLGAAAHAYLGEVPASWEVPLYDNMNGITFEGD
jgi:hypothetical protein